MPKRLLFLVLILGELIVSSAIAQTESHNLNSPKLVKSITIKEFETSFTIPPPVWDTLRPTEITIIQKNIKNDDSLITKNWAYNGEIIETRCYYNDTGGFVKAVSFGFQTASSEYKKSKQYSDITTEELRNDSMIMIVKDTLGKIEFDYRYSFATLADGSKDINYFELGKLRHHYKYLKKEYKDSVITLDLIKNRKTFTYYKGDSTLSWTKTRNGRIIESNVLIKDSHNNIIKQKFFTKKFHWKWTKTFEYVYDANGNWLKRLEHHSQPYHNLIIRKINYR